MNEYEYAFAANALVCSGQKRKRQIGYIETKTLTYDGNKEGKDTFLGMDDMNYVRIGNVIDIREITAVTLNDTEIKASDLEFASEGGADIVLYAGAVGIYVFTNDGNVPAGTYVLDDGYVITKVVTETIHPIDPKFLYKTIDLTKYEVEATKDGITVSGALNDAVLNMFSTGGGSAAVGDNSSLWNDLNTNSPLSFVIDASSVFPGIKITTEANSITAVNSVPNAVEFSFLVQVQTWHKVTVVLGDNFNGTTQITVVVEPLIIPGA